MDIDQNVLIIANEIKVYLLKRPFAADTLDGVVQWWIKQQRIDEQVSLVKKALAILEQNGIVAQRTNASGEILFIAMAQSHEHFSKDS